MTLFSGLDDILKCVIENTAYVENGKIRDNFPDEQRFHNAIKAIFGDIDREEYRRPPKGYTYAEMMFVHSKHVHGTPLETAIKDMVTSKNPEPKRAKFLSDPDEKQKAEDAYWEADSNRDRQCELDFNRIKTHFYDHKEHYKNKQPLWQSKTPETDDEILNMIVKYDAEQKEKTEEITAALKNLIKALRKADWPL